MTREQQLKLFAFNLFSDGYTSSDIDKIRKDNILTPYETEVIEVKLREIECEFRAIERVGNNENNL